MTYFIITLYMVYYKVFLTVLALDAFGRLPELHLFLKLYYYVITIYKLLQKTPNLMLCLLLKVCIKINYTVSYYFQMWSLPYTARYWMRRNMSMSQQPRLSPSQPSTRYFLLVSDHWLVHYKYFSKLNWKCHLMFTTG